MNFARLNHILIPTSKVDRDRVRGKLYWRLAAPLFWLYSALTVEGRFVFMFAIVAGAMGLDVAYTQGYLLWCVVFAAICASLLMRRWFLLSDVQLTIDYPRRVRVGEPATITVTAINRGERDYRAIRGEGPMLPWDGKWVAQRPELARLAPGERRPLTFAASFSVRGHHHLEEFEVASAVPLGLAKGRAVESECPRFVVIPHIAPVRALRLPLGHRFQPGGVALASKTGESMELFGIRPYRVGDRIRDLHPQSWARMGFPVVREYQQEYFARVGVIVDTDRDAATEPQMEAIISLAAGVVAHLSRGEALIDLLVTGDQLHPLTLGRSLGFLEQALDHLACARPGPPLAAGLLAHRLTPYLGRLSCVVLLTLNWGHERQNLAARIEEQGVACRVITVPQDSDDGPRAPTVLTINDVTQRESILL